MKEKIKQCLRQHLFLIEQEEWYDADKIAEDLAKVFSSNAVLAVSLLNDEIKELKGLAHIGLPEDCVAGESEVKFCHFRQGDGNMCKHCSNYNE